MKVLYCDATLGVSGDMFLGALVDLGVSIEILREAARAAGIENWRITGERVQRKGLAATRVTVDVEEGHCHRSLSDMCKLIAKSSLDTWVKGQAVAVFERIARAESEVHGKALEEIHFHEVGALDAVIDVVGTLAGIGELGAHEIIASPVAVGSGTVQAAHGVLPVPAPATAALLRGFEVTGGDLEGECSTPTGVALLVQLAASQGAVPDMTLAKVGCGAGSRDASTHPNCFRLLMGERADGAGDVVVVLETNVDDMPAQLVGPLYERLLAAGALDVTVTAVQMKKGRPGLLISVIAEPAGREALEEILFRETTTLGVRRHTARRTVLERRGVTVECRYGKIDVKEALRGGQVVTATPEFDQCLAAAKAHGTAVREVCDAVRAAWARGKERD